MSRPSAIFAFALAALFIAAPAGCSSSMASSHEVNSPNGFPGGFSLVAPGPRDVGNVHLPAVMVVTRFPGMPPMQCSGVLIDPRAAVTAAHCVCLPREPTPEDKLSQEKSPKPMAEPTLTRAEALQDVIITDIIDKDSSCAQVTSVTAVVYESRRPGKTPIRYDVVYEGTVLLHPMFELIAGIKQEEKRVFWNNADLAVVTFEDPMPFEWPTVSLSSSEVEVGDALVMAGYGSGDSDEAYGSRHSGENEVTRVVKFNTGNVLFGVPASLGPDHKPRAQARRGDSGGAAVREEDRSVLIGIIAMDSEAKAGTENKMSWFTSIYPYRHWLLEIMRQLDLAADAGVSVPDSDAGVEVLGSDAETPPSPPPAAQ